jgi:hypothetical protein
MHNIDVMHQESNFCQALINTCMDFPDKTKDNDKACMDLAVICDRPTQVLRENGGKPKADYCLFQGSSSSSSRRRELLSAVHGDEVTYLVQINLFTYLQINLKLYVPG